MVQIETYVFFDLGTTDIKIKPIKITEIHMIAMDCADLRRYFRDGGEEYFEKKPATRKLHCQLSGDGMMWINEDYDEDEYSLADETVAFLNDLKKPICLIAHNGNTFDFSLLRTMLAEDEEFSPEYIACADSMAAFYDICEPCDAPKTSYQKRKRGSFPWPDDYYDKRSYSLNNLYKRIMGKWPNLETAELRNNALTEIALDRGFEFMLWVAENKHAFESFSE